MKRRNSVKIDGNELQRRKEERRKENMRNQKYIIRLKYRSH